MNSTLIISPSGVRGVVGKGLTPGIVTNLASAFGELMGGEILVGYDTRTSNNMFKYAVFSGLLSVGCKIVDLGVCPTPSLQFMVKETGANGGIAITGSHNPPEWNALKFVRSDGLFLFPEEGERLIEIYREGNIRRSAWNSLGSVLKDNSAISRHIKRILEVVNVDRIRGKNFKVAIDACCGAGAIASPLLLEKLGCDVITLNCNTTGMFPHPPEPTPANLRDLCRVVKEAGADVGFAHDADADRLALVSEKGEAISEEYTLVMVTKSILQKSKGFVVTNICSSQAVDDIAGEFGCPVKRTPVGDVYVSRCMRDCGAVIGGEGNGGVIFPPVNYARDGMTALALVLDYLASENIPISSVIDSLPSYYMFKRKIKNPGINLDRLKHKLSREFNSSKLDFLDGIKIWFPEGWVHIRASGTEPVLRIIGESKDPSGIKKLTDWALGTISSLKR